MTGTKNRGERKGHRGGTHKSQNTEMRVTEHGWRQLKADKEWKNPHTAQIYLILTQVTEKLIHPVKDQSFSCSQVISCSCQKMDYEESWMSISGIV